MASGARDETTVSAVCAALRPYPWRSFTPERLARSVIAASDRQSLREMLVTMPGTALGTWDDVEPADVDDVRVAPLVEFLACHPWTQLSLRSLSTQLVAVLDSSSR